MPGYLCRTSAVLALLRIFGAGYLDTDGCCAHAAIGHAAAAPPSRVMNSRRFVCREKSIVRGDGGSVMTVFLSRLEARGRFG